MLPGELSIADALTLEEGRADEPNSSSPGQGTMVTADLQRASGTAGAANDCARCQLVAGSGDDGGPPGVVPWPGDRDEIADKALDGHSDYAHWQEPL